MRKFLLTWYGITDFRASLEFEHTDGPIAAALAAGHYSDVVILCYTRADAAPDECAATHAAFEHELAAIRAAGHEKDWKTTADFVSRFANTEAAHRHFERWLKKKAHEIGRFSNFVFKSERLRELNDSEGIYACAIRALDLVAEQSGDKLVTLYLSPGTPVMAYVWSLAALARPGLKKRLIASPVIGKPPETVALPAEWLDRYGVNQRAIRHADDGFDVTFHLFGEQRMPALLGIRQFESKRHIFVNSKAFPASCMQPFLSDGQPEELNVDPWDARAVRERIMHVAESLSPDDRIGMNVTGGTKLMFAGALSAARALGAVPFYFDSQHRRVTFVDSLHSSAIKPVDSVETFLKLHGDGLTIEESGVAEVGSPDRLRLTEALWKHRSEMTKHYNRLCEIRNKHRNRRQATAFRVQCGSFVFSMDDNHAATAVVDDLNLRFENWPDFASYLSGGWLEEYVYLHCRPYEDRGVIKDLRINVKLKLSQKAGHERPKLTDFNELDITFTDGHSLYIVECKAGNVTQDHVMKLQNLVRYYGGVEGRGILACCFGPEREAIRRKIENAGLAVCPGPSFSDQLKTLMDGIAARAGSVGVA
ncbi:Card1-like endonuclease domain-containing protein [Caballeronia sp. S22]|uniref:Card1-like endonuclease domain-containing protein n=1 Tax=Caballeronia sp. S22 TaxID=3137182 RepID=UPI003530BB05